MAIMRSVLSFLTAGCLLAVCSALVRADDQADAKPVLDKAIKALGGEDKLAKLTAGTWKGKITGRDNGMDVTLTTEGSWQGLDQYRIDGDAMIGGDSHKGVLVINGDKGWILGKADAAQDAPKEVLGFVKDLFYSMRAPHLLSALKDKAFQLSPLGEVKVGNRPAVGLRVVHKDHKDLSLFFDKYDGLPVKSEIRLADPQGKEITVEYFYSDYKDYDGLKHCAKVVIKADGKEFAMDLSEVKAEGKLDDSVFAKP
jgi:hypothetical protein